MYRKGLFKGASLLITVMVLSLVLFSPAVRAEENEMVQRGGSGIALLNLDDLNNALEDEGYKGFNGTMYLAGGGAYREFSNGFRLGGLGYRGSTKTSFQDGNGQFSLSYGGLLLEGKIDITDSVALLAGGLAGVGSVDLKINESIPESFDAALNNTPVTHKLSKGFYGVQPMLVMEVSLFPSFSVRASASYLWGPANKWDMAGKKFGGPLDSITAPVFGLSFHFAGSGSESKDESSS
jgi:hypothetical protein